MDDFWERRSYDLAVKASLPQATVRKDSNRDPCEEEDSRKFQWSWLLPFRPTRIIGKATAAVGRPCPTLEAGWLSIASFHWMTPTIWKGFRDTLHMSDLWHTHPDERAEAAGENVLGKWREQVAAKDGDALLATPGRAFLKAYRVRVAATVFCMIIYQVLSFVSTAVLVYQLLNYAQKEKSKTTLKEGLLLVFGFCLCEVLRALLFASHWHISIGTGLRARAALNYIVYDKLMRLRNLGGMTVGQLVNLCVNDGQRLFECGVMSAFMAGAPVMCILVISYTVYLVGWPALIGASTFFLFYPLQGYFGRKTAIYRRKGVKITDQRVRIMNEILICVKLIKMYAWELSFAQAVAAIRKRERKMLEGSQLMMATTSALTPVVPAVAGVLTFAVKTLTGGNLTVAEAFAVLSSFNAMRFSLAVLPFGVRAITEARVAMPRLHKLLLQPDLSVVPDSVENEGNAIEFKVATFRWDEKLVLQPAPSVANGSAPDGSAMSKDKKDHLESSTEKQSQKEKKLERQRRQSLRELLETDMGDGVDKAAVDCLVDISLQVERGQLVGICGAFGSGKSSLLTSLLGGLKLKQGSIAVKGSMAFVSQQAWIINASIQENILFGKEMDHDRYQRVLSVSALRPDLAILQDGDQTEIGERGINLSGGQKQRVALARALYADRDIYLLDDPLSAVDAHVGSSIFNELIKRELKGRTVFLVTHQLQYLQSCDHVVLMDAGRIIEQGSYAKLMAAEKSFSALMNQYLHQDDDDCQQETTSTMEQVVSNPSLLSQKSRESEKNMPSYVSQKSKMSTSEGEKEQPLKLVVEEDRTIGVVRWSTYKAFMKAAGGYFISVFILLYTALAVGMKGIADWWLSRWLRDGGGNITTVMVNNTSITYEDLNLANNPDLERYVGIFFALNSAFVILVLSRALLFAHMMLSASSNLHDSVFKKVFCAPLTFFEQTPTGRILNRFSKDLDEIDTQLPFFFSHSVLNVCLISLAVIIVAAVFPVLLAVIACLFVLLVLVNRMFNSTTRNLKRLEGISRSPLLSHLGSSVQGLATVHAFKKHAEYQRRFHKVLNENTVCMQAFQASSRWLGVRLDLLTMVLLVSTALLVVLTRGDIAPSLAALALTYIAQVGSLLQFTVRTLAESEARFTSVERLNYYATELEEEEAEDAAKQSVAGSWPSEGRIAFRGVSMRYRKETPCVLHNLTLDVHPCEKIGVVGRTGAGKSSLAVCLFRLRELEEGQIFIDNVDISSIGLGTLRSRLSIIPQDPVLFVGTLRYNLDPFDTYSDGEIWDALERTHLKQTVIDLVAGLQTKVVENGENFSVGERQLICMARALLRHSKILVLDEATASIDSETDTLIQKTIRSCFADCTLLTIAHRINTVLDSDRILVMDKGHVVEFDTPASLLAQPKSLLSQLVAAAAKDMAK